MNIPSIDPKYNPFVTKVILFIGFISTAFFCQHYTSFNQVVFLWLPSGFALAGTILFKHRFLLWIVLASTMWNSYFFYSISAQFQVSHAVVSLLIGIGTALQAYVGSILLHRFAMGQLLRNKLSGIFLYFLFAGILVCLISPLVGVSSLFILNHTWNLTLFFENVRIWWLGDTFGVLTVSLPLLILFSNYAKKGVYDLRYRNAVLFIYFFTVTFFVLFGSYSKERYKSEIKYRLEKDAVRFAEAINQQDTRNNMALIALEGYIEPQSNLNQTNFKIFADHILNATPSLKAISWNYAVPQNDIENFTEKIRNEGGVSDFKVKGLPLDSADPYAVVTFIEPIEENRGAQGFNVFSRPDRKNAMLVASKSGKNFATPLLKLVQDSASVSFLVFHPVYKKSSDSSVLGFCVGVYDAHRLLNKALSSTDLPDNVLFRVYTDEQDSVIWQNKEQSENYIASIPVHISFTISGRAWHLVALPSLEYAETTSGKIRSVFQLFLVLLASAVSLLIWYFSNAYYNDKIRVANEELLLEKTFNRINETHNIAYNPLISNAEIEQSKVLRANVILQTINSLTLSLIDSTKEVSIFALNLQKKYMVFNNAHKDFMQMHFNLSIQVEDEYFKNLNHERFELVMLHNFSKAIHGAAFSVTDNFTIQGNSFWFQVSYNPISDDEGNVIGLTCFLVDVSEKHAMIEELKDSKNRTEQMNEELRTAHEELEKNNTELEKMNKTKAKIFSIISHDLRSPFSAILGYSENLFKEYDSFDESSRKMFLQYIVSSSKVVFDLLTNLLDWSRSQMGNISFSPDYFNIDLLINEAIQQVSISANIKNITISYSYINMMVYADKNLIVTVLRNILHNAVKFSNKNSEVKVSVFDDNNALLVQIADEGVGMSKDTANKLFTENKLKSEYGTNGEAGTGIGLQLCQEFVRKHGGEIWVESEVDKGTVFSFTIPKRI